MKRKRIFTVLMGLLSIVNIAMLLAAFFIYRYRYPHLYFQELGRTQICILLLPFLPTVLAYLGRMAAERMIATGKSAWKAVTGMLLIGMIPAAFFGAVCTVCFIMIPPLASVTDRPADYLQLDGDLGAFQRVAKSFYPEHIPEGAEQINYHYERYSSLFSDHAMLKASWVLTPENYEEEKANMQNHMLLQKGTASGNEQAGAIAGTIYPENVTVMFEYNDKDCRVTYQARAEIIR